MFVTKLNGGDTTIHTCLLYNVEVSRTLSKFSNFYYNQSTVLCGFDSISSCDLSLNEKHLLASIDTFLGIYLCFT